MDKHDEKAGEIVPCDCGRVGEPPEEHKDECLSHLRPKFATALREAAQEGARKENEACQRAAYAEAKDLAGTVVAQAVVHAIKELMRKP